MSNIDKVPLLATNQRVTSEQQRFVNLGIVQGLGIAKSEALATLGSGKGVMEYLDKLQTHVVVYQP